MTPNAVYFVAFLLLLEVKGGDCVCSNSVNANFETDFDGFTGTTGWTTTKQIHGGPPDNGGNFLVFSSGDMDLQAPPISCSGGDVCLSFDYAIVKSNVQLRVAVVFKGHVPSYNRNSIGLDNIHMGNCPGKLGTTQVPTATTVIIHNTDVSTRDLTITSQRATESQTTAPTTSASASAITAREQGWTEAAWASYNGSGKT
ncbi:hypothetical protein BaRGS_00005081 [Batillaria attramentaria]|uniref:Uncharacterized protein n=1 Tax=Batillaria attramentaria TaxID=370345 RepID=A0ABD0LW09_9CAEN